MKKILSVALVIVLAIAIAIPAFAANVDESKTYENGLVVDGSTGWNSSSGDQYLLEGDFDVTITFTNEPFIRDESNWSNFVFEIFGGADTKGITLRADAYGWTYGDETQEPTYTVEKTWGDDWSNFVDMCKANPTVTLNVKKTSDTTVTVTVSFGSAATETYTITYAAGVPETMRVQVGADGGKVTILSVEIKTADEGDETETPDEGDETETPDEGDETETPDEGDETETPDEGDETETPDEGDETETPDEGDETETPDDGDETETPDDGDEAETPDDSDEAETVETPKITGSLTVTAFFNEKTNFIPLKSGDTYTFKFKNTSNGTANNGEPANWENFVLAITGAADAASNSADTEILILRADAWGWGGGNSDFVAPGTDGNALVFDTNIDWDQWAAAVKAGVDVTITLKRTGNTLSYSATIGDWYVKLTATSGKTLPETAYVFFTGENVTLSNITTTVPTSSGATQTGDAVAPYTMAVLAVIAIASAAGIAVLLKKKVTD